MAKQKKKGELEIPPYVMDDLCSRFVINCDGNHLDQIRVFYITEQAYWHYIDFFCNEQPQLPRCSHKALTKYIFMYVSELNQFLPDFETLYQDWMTHKRTIPSYGGILLSPDYKHVLMVQGYTSKTSWGFPKGKVEILETGIECAVREIEEETGIDVRDKILEEQHLECKFQDQKIVLYIIPGIQTDMTMQPKLRKEIREYKWFPVDALPTHKNDTATKLIGMEPNNFFKVIPFVRNLRRWIENKLDENQPVPACEFTAKGRRGKGKEGHRRQGLLGPQGDAPASREGQGRNSRQSQVARNLGDQFSEQTVGQMAQHGKNVQILMRGGGASSGQWDQHQDGVAGKLRTKAAEKPTNLGKLHLHEFHSKAMLNFKFDVEAILDCIKW